MFHWRKAVVLGSMIASIGAAEAASILDTGPGMVGAPLVSLGTFQQNLGVTFNVASASSISSVEGWIGASNGGDVQFELHAGASPTGTLLFSSLVSIGSTSTGAPDDWYGATGLDWDVAAGDYTLTVIAQSGFSGWMRAAPPNPAGTEWFSNPTGWFTTTFNMGWRVDAIAAPIPEPEIYAMLGAGLGFIGWAARRRKHQTA